jgi:hypothetical protein
MASKKGELTQFIRTSIQKRNAKITQVTGAKEITPL